mmetsp:Transcript_24530/g.56982  ORF Transcript_24530/g.56982 Transcript_24530/m.56982 type:complete len:80 (-) Transcript_24530:618-857(-)
MAISEDTSKLCLGERFQLHTPGLHRNQDPMDMGPTRRSQNLQVLAALRDLRQLRFQVQTVVILCTCSGPKASRVERGCP